MKLNKILLILILTIACGLSPLHAAEAASPAKQVAVLHSSFFDPKIAVCWFWNFSHIKRCRNEINFIDHII